MYFPSNNSKTARIFQLIVKEKCSHSQHQNIHLSTNESGIKKRTYLLNHDIPKNVHSSCHGYALIQNIEEFFNSHSLCNNHLLVLKIYILKGFLLYFFINLLSMACGYMSSMVFMNEKHCCYVFVLLLKYGMDLLINFLKLFVKIFPDVKL